MNYYEEGKAHGTARGSWVFDGNTPYENYRWVLAGYDDGDPEVLDLCPNPLSGEWAGESIPELLGLSVGDPYPDDDDLQEYEDGFVQGFWAEVIGTARTMVNA
jgi:hypothetical protein